MEEAGYTYNADGMLEKDGQPFKVDLPVGDKRAKVAEILQEQFRALGVDVTIKLLEDVNGPMFGGDFEILVNGFGFSEAHILVLFFGNDEIGGVNLPKFDDPELQELLAATITTIDPAERQEVVNAVVTRVVEQALIVPLYATTTFTAMSTRIKNAHPSPVANVVWLVGAYIEAD